MNPREHIEMIQQETVASDRVREMLNNSIQKLSTELYQKDTHFIFELIQNAEDNKYDDLAEPSLVFHLLSTNPTNTLNSNGTLWMENNEVGFSEKNINAICTVNKSTKKKIEGYIGEKGIGFKSVFKVSSLPHIFSHGYEFNLPEHDESSGFGFIYPRWVDSIPDNLSPSGTTIVLPLNKNDYTFEKMEGDLCDIKSETIIFLTQVKKLKIIIDKHYERTICKDDSQYPLVKICTETYNSKSNTNQKIVEKYWVHTKLIDVPEDAINEKRADIENRPLTIAFPLSPASKSAGQIFAYLPIQSDSGLPFLVNADFLLTANREGIEDNKWNKWLRDCVAEVFVETFELAIDNEEYRMDAYKFIPLDANNEFLRPIVEPIHEKLLERKIILTQPDFKKCFPSEAMTAPASFRSLITNPYPKHLLNTRLVCPELEKFKKQLTEIKIGYFATTDIIECLKDKEWIEHHGQDPEWLIDLYKYLESKKMYKYMLIDCPIVPVRNKDSESSYFSCTSKQAIYFDYDTNLGDVLSKTPPCVKINLAFLDKDLCNIIDADLKRWMTESLDICLFSKEHYAIDVANWLIDNFTEMDEDDLVSVTYFIAQFADLKNSNIDIPILLNDGSRKLISNIKKPDQQVVTPACLNIENGWQNIFVTKEDRGHLAILSDKYVQNSNSNIELLISWDKFEITKYPLSARVEKQCYMDYGGQYLQLNISLTEYEKKHAQYVYEHHSAQSRALEIKSTNYKNLTSMDSQDNEIKQKWSCSMINWLNTKLNKTSNQYGANSWLLLEIEYQHYRKQIKIYDSSFYNDLKNKPWVYTTKGFSKPSHTFVPEKHIKEVLGDSVPYVTDEISDEVIKFLGIRNEATSDELIEILEERSKNNIESKDFALSAYKHLNSIELNQKVISRFKTDNLIYIPSDKGRWVSLNDTIWPDQSDVLGEGDDFVYLEKIYPELKHFFVDILGVNENVDAEVFAEQWLSIQDGSSISSDKIEAILTKIYRELLPICKEDGSEKPNWWDRFVQNAQIWTQDNIFVDKKLVYVPDDVDLKNIFNNQGINFTWRPEHDSFSQWAPLYRALKISYLSKSVNISFVGDDSLVEDEPKYLTVASKVLIETWLAQSDSDYERLKEINLLDILRKSKEAYLECIRVVYELNNKKVQTDREAYWNRDNGILFLSKNSTQQDKQKNAIALTLARALMPRAYKDFAIWIELVLCETDHEWRIKQKDLPVPVDLKTWLESNKDKIKDEPSDGGGVTPTRVGKRDDGKSPKTNVSRDKTKRQPVFPVRQVSDSEIRIKNIKEKLKNAPRIKNHERTISVGPTHDNRDRIHDLYLNEINQMICQICKQEMPFKIKDKYFFAAVDAFKKSCVASDARFLALCPVCAARYKIFIKMDKDAMEKFETDMLNLKESDLEIPVKLGELTSTVRFVESHFIDIKAYLDLDRQKRLPQ